MDRESAKRLLDALAHNELPLAKMGRVLQELEGDEQDWLKERLKALLTSHMDMLDEVVRQYPEFDLLEEGEDLWYELRKKYETSEFPARKMSAEESRTAEEAGNEAANEIQAEMRDRGDA